VLQNKEKVNIDWAAQIHGVGRTAAMLTVALLALFLLISLVSYSKADPGWRQSYSAGEITNLGGLFGAFLADALFSLLGFMAYLIPLVLLIRFVQRVQGPRLEYGWLGWLWRFSGFLLLVLSGAGLSDLYDYTNLLPAGAGGALGQALADPLSSQFGVIGASLLGFLAFILGLTLSADVDWLQTLDRLGGITLKLLSKMAGLLKSIGQKKEKDEKEFKEPVLQVQNIEPMAIPKAVGKRNNINVSSATQDTKQVDKEETARFIDKITKKKESKSQAKSADTPTAKPEKKIKIQPFEKKSKGQVATQGNLFDTSELPSIDLLNRQDGPQESGYSAEQLEDMSRLLEQKLKDFGVKVEVVAVNPGPVITRFEIQPAPGVKASKITNLASDLARSLAMPSVRVVEVIPGKSVMGLEVPNENRAMVFLGDTLASTEYQSGKSPLTVGLGHDIAGDPVTADLAKMPHLLVAGTTGSGKSVGVNSMLISMLYKSTPDDVRFIMVDPKMLELSVYDGIPHLLTPVITDMKEAANGLRWCVGEMERRYKLMAALGVRNIAGYNKKVLEAAEAGEPIKDPLWKAEESLDQIQPDLGKLPYIVVVIDEFADMMMIVGKKVEELIARIAQKARAAGIHLILATQRPSVDIITGLIKANVPTRMAFRVSSRIDSRTILDQGGAEQLLGHGDMLYLPPGSSLPVRVHGAFVDDDEVHAVVAEWKKRGEPEFIDAITDGGEANIPGVPAAEGAEGDGEQDALFDEAVAFVTQTRKVSISSVQRKLRIGYNRAARLVETMEEAGVVSEPGHNGSREVLAPPPVS
jgi:S-DNA-T family DNA segregation ATPase FtsK/SpoIIIE